MLVYQEEQYLIWNPLLINEERAQSIYAPLVMTRSRPEQRKPEEIAA